MTRNEVKVLLDFVTAFASLALAFGIWSPSGWAAVVQLIELVVENWDVVAAAVAAVLGGGVRVAWAVTDRAARRARELGFRSGYTSAWGVEPPSK